MIKRIQDRCAMLYGRIRRIDLVFMSVMSLICVVLIYLPTPHQVEHNHEGEKSKATVLTVDNSERTSLGLMIYTGHQTLTVKVKNGSYRGDTFTARNQFRSQMDLDKSFEVGDTILVGIPLGAQPGVTAINAQDYYRVNDTLWLLAIFSGALICFAGIVGIKALLSFVFSCLMIWKVLIPLCLAGVQPECVVFGVVAGLTAVILFLVSGFNRRGCVALCGAMLGIGVGAIASAVLTRLFHVNGAAMPYAQSLLYSGYANLSLSALYSGATVLACSGAVMDLAMDISAGMTEVVRHRQTITRPLLFASGWRIGVSVVGTMTTTLLFAYAGGYLTLMMTFVAQGTSILDFINHPHVASEVLKTLAGSLTLVLVAPFTALTGALFLRPKVPRSQSLIP